jgi:CRISPR-associated protein Csd1
MILSALYDLAQREGLLEDPDFETRRVDFYLRFDDRGRFLALVPTADESGRAAEIAAPRAPKRSGTGAVPGFLFDNAKYVLGIGKEGATDSRMAACAAAFREVASRCAEATKDEGVIAAVSLLAHLDRELPKVFKARTRREWTGSEWIALVRESDGRKPVHARPKVKAYWKKLRGGEGAPGTDAMRCLVTGQLAPPSPTHPNIKRVPQAQTSGAALVSFNCDAFESHGLVQGANAPVSRAAAEGYVTALNWLLEGNDKRAHQYGVRLGNDGVTVFWTHERNGAPDYLVAALDASHEEFVKLAEAPFRGLEPEDTDATRFYAMTLSGNSARIVVRDWFATTAGEVKASILRFFEDLRIGSAPRQPIPVWALLSALEPRSGRGLSPSAAGKLFRSALRGGPLPHEFLAAALRRLRLPPRDNEATTVLRRRCAIVKAALIRSPRSGTRTTEVPVSLEPAKNDVPYLLGRLFAVLERLQGAAQGDVNATIRDRWFGAASATPALAFPRLLRLSMHHAAKAERGGWLEKLKGEIVGALPATPFPGTLSLADQGLFAVGYYHQREKFFEKRAEVPAAQPDPA